MSKIESVINNLQNNITNDLDQLVSKLKHTLDMQKPIVTRIQELKDNIDPSLALHASASCEQGANNLIEVNFGGEYVSVNVDVVMNPLIPHNFLSLLFHPHWRKLLPKDKEGRIYFEWEYQWIQPIIEVFKLIDHDNDQEKSEKTFPNEITCWWEGGIDSPLPILFNEIFAIPSVLNTDNHCIQISCKGLPLGQPGCTEIETFKRLLLIMHPHQLRSMLDSYVLRRFDSLDIRFEIADWLTHGVVNGNLKDYKVERIDHSYSLSYDSSSILLLCDPEQQQFYCFHLSPSKDTGLWICWSTDMQRVTKRLSLKWKQHDDRYILQLMNNDTQQLICEIDTITKQCVLPNMITVSEDDGFIEFAQTRIIQNCIILPLKLKPCNIEYGYDDDEEEEDDDDDEDYDDNNKEVTQHASNKKQQRKENANTNIIQQLPTTLSNLLTAEICNMPQQQKECTKLSSPTLQMQHDIESLDCILNTQTSLIHKYLYVQCIEAKFLKAICIEQHFQSINASEYCLGSVKHKIQEIATAHMKTTTDEVVIEVLLDRIHIIYEQLALQTSLEAQQMKTNDIVYFNVEGETVCLLKSSILFAIPDSQLAIRVSGQWTETENTMDNERRLIIPYPRILFSPLVEMIRKASMLRIKPLAIFYPNKKLCALAKKMLQYFSIDTLEAVIHRER